MVKRSARLSPSGYQLPHLPRQPQVQTAAGGYCHPSSVGDSLPIFEFFLSLIDAISLSFSLSLCSVVLLSVATFSFAYNLPLCPSDCRHHSRVFHQKVAERGSFRSTASSTGSQTTKKNGCCKTAFHCQGLFLCHCVMSVDLL